MKNIIFLILTLLIALFFSCKKTEVHSDKISTYEINEILLHESVDSVSELTTVFEIYKVGDSLQARLIYPIPLLLRDGGSTYLTDSKTGNIIALKAGETISDKNNWNDTISSNSFSLNNFKGKGEMFIGTRHYSFLDGIVRINYGWLKIYLSSNCDTLKILDGAANMTLNNSIYAGQTK